MRYCKGTVCVCVLENQSRDKDVVNFLKVPEMPEADIATNSTYNINKHSAFSTSCLILN